jgi:hypothetical protein
MMILVPLYRLLLYLSRQAAIASRYGDGGIQLGSGIATTAHR